MKVVEVISDTNVGGAGVLLVNRLKHTDLNKYKTTVLLPKGSLLKFKFESMGVRVVELNCRGDKSFDVSALIKYMSVLKKIKPDIINSHGSLTSRIVAYILGVPVKICTRHCVFPIDNKHPLLLRFKGALNTLLSDRFIAVAYAAKENLEGLFVNSQKIVVIINGAQELNTITDAQKAELRAKLGIKKQTCVLSMCARLEDCKGHKYFFDSLRILAKKNIDFKALLIGDGSKREELKELCVRYGIDDRVIFVGFVKDVSPYMNITDININCSVGTETSSLALSEGMSLGIPAVVSDYGGNPYMVKDGVNGFVCGCRNSIMMADRIEQIINDRDIYERMSYESRKRFLSELNAKNMTENTCRLYDKLYDNVKRAEENSHV